MEIQAVSIKRLVYTSNASISAKHKKTRSFLFLVLDHRSYIRVAKLKPEKNSGLNGIRTHDLCDTGTGSWSLSEFYLIDNY